MKLGLYKNRYRNKTY